MVAEEVQPEKRKDFSLHKHCDAISISASNLKSTLSQEYANAEHKDFSILKEEADNGSAQAQFLIRVRYCRGEGIEQSYSSAAHYCQLAAMQNHPEAQFLLALLYENGLGMEESNKKLFIIIILQLTKKK